MSEEIARRVSGAFNSGRTLKLTFSVTNRRVLTAEITDVIENTVSLRTFVPGASGVSLLTNGSVAR